VKYLASLLNNKELAGSFKLYTKYIDATNASACIDALKNGKKVEVINL
jgi:hypothetical protein